MPTILAWKLSFTLPSMVIENVNRILWYRTLELMAQSVFILVGVVLMLLIMSSDGREFFFVGQRYRWVEERERYPPAYFVQPPLRKGVNSSFSN